ncbi:FecR family protein [Chitinophaga lutea]
MNRQEAAELLDRYEQGTATPAERALVEHWYEAQAAGKQLADDQHFEQLNNEIWQGTLRRAGLQPAIRRILPAWARVAAAAAIVALIAGGWWGLQQRRAAPAPTIANTAGETIVPGSNKATLQLGSGPTISLTDAANGKLADHVAKKADGELVYQPGGEPSGTMHTLSTPRGGQYRLDLPDGSRVWLNAASSLRFPPSFDGEAERRVELNGEAYFEIAADARRPFRVVSAGQTLEVLGTHFNINAYGDEPAITTTLLSGSVKVNGALLKPGQRSVLQDGQINIQPADTELATAWKNGEFRFNGQDFQSVMRMISRWYDVDIEYEEMPRPMHIAGVVSRSRNIREVLRMIEVMGDVKFNIEGKRITVTR